jgi:hypothetical protein
MTKWAPVPPLFRSFRAAGLAAFLLCHSIFAASAAPSASVVAIEPTRVADLVLLRGGFDAGLREGMVCRISRGTTEVAEVLLVEVRPSGSAALILNLAPNQAIRAGDVAGVKFSKPSQSIPTKG